MDQKIDINSADASTLAQLEGIGEKLAQRIIEYRETVHPFEEVIELTAVPGITERMVRQFEDQVTIEAVVAGTLPMTTPIPANNLQLTSETAQQAADTDGDGDGNGEATAVSAVEDQEETTDLPPLHEAPLDDDTRETPAVEAAVVPEPNADDEPDPAPPIQIHAEESEPVMASEPLPTQLEPPPPPTGDDTVSRRRGCIFVIIGAVFGAVLGTALTLALLSAINDGSLRFVQADNRLRLQIDDANRQLEALNAQLQTADEQLNAAETRIGELAGEQGTISDALSDVETAVATTESNIDALSETAVDLDERLDTVADAAETFDTFLDGMRDLLVTLQGPPPTATPTVTPTAVPTEADAGDAPDAGTSTPTSAATQPPTRTPRPTATSIVSPTATPEQQP